MSVFTIKELSILSNIKPHTIRIWEQRYNILEPNRTEANFRAYTDKDACFILKVSSLNQNGYRISQIAQMTDDQVEANFTHLLRNTKNPEILIQAMFMAMIKLEEDTFTKYLESAIYHLGFEEAVKQIFFPFINRTSAVWLKGKNHSSCEHFSHHLIRNQMILAISKLRETPNRFAKTYLLFLPENEHHEFSLLYASYIIRTYGHSVVYLGSSVAVENVAEIVEKRAVDFLFTTVYNTSSRKRLKNYFDKLVASVPDAEIIMSGSAVTKIQNDLSQTIRLLTTPMELIGQLEKESQAA